MAPGDRNRTKNDEYFYSDESFEESYASDGEHEAAFRKKGQSQRFKSSRSTATVAHSVNSSLTFNNKSSRSQLMKGKKKKNNSQLNFFPSQFKDEAIQQWCHDQITKNKNLQNRLSEMTQRCEELLEENRDLKKQCKLSEKALVKLEKDQKNVPSLLREHSADIRRLRKNVTEEHKNKEDLEKRNRRISDEMMKMREENREMRRMLNDKDLFRKQADISTIQETENKLYEAQRKNEENERMMDLQQKNHKSEMQRMQQKVRQAQLEREETDLKNKDLETKLQEKEKELAIHYIYAQRLAKPPSRLVHTPPRHGVLVHKSTVTDRDPIIENLEKDKLLLQHEIEKLKRRIESFGETAKYLDEEKARLDEEALERAAKEKQFQDEMDQAKREAEEAERQRREELEQEADRERVQREEEAARRRQEEQERVARERVEWEAAQRKKIEEEVIREIKTHYQQRLNQVDAQILSQLKEKKKQEARRLGLVPEAGSREGRQQQQQQSQRSSHSHAHQHSTRQPCKGCQRRDSKGGAATGPGPGSSTGAPGHVDPLPAPASAPAADQHTAPHSAQHQESQPQPLFTPARPNHNSTEEDVFQEQQRELEEENSRKRETLMHRLKSIEDSASAPSKLQPFASVPAPRSRDQDLDPPGTYSRQNSSQSITNQNFTILNSNQRKVGGYQPSGSSYSSNQSKSIRSAKREDTEAKLAAILGMDDSSSRRRNRDPLPPTGQSSSKQEYEFDFITSSSRRKSPSFTRPQNETSPVLPLSQNKQRKSIHQDDLEELLL